MIERLPRRILMLIMLPAVVLLVVIGLVNFDLMVGIVARLIPVIAIAGVLDFIVKKMFFTGSNTEKEVKNEEPENLPEVPRHGENPPTGPAALPERRHRDSPA